MVQWAEDIRRGLRVPGLLIGVGLGAFFDGIVFHQVLQWHHLISSERSVTTVAGLEANTLADGLFQAAAWLLLLAGVLLLWRSARIHDGVGPIRGLVGWMLVGWGAFNVVEGLVNHHLLQLHHVREGGQQTGWDIGFLVVSVAIAAVGLLLTREARSRRPEEVPALWR